MCANTSGVLVELKTYNYGQNPLYWGPKELHTTKARSCGFLASWAILGKNHQKFQISKIDVDEFTKNSGARILGIE